MTTLGEFRSRQEAELEVRKTGEKFTATDRLALREALSRGDPASNWMKAVPASPE